MEKRLDRINEHLSIYQYTDGFAYGTDAVLISAFCRAKKGDLGADFGTGTGIIPILLCHHKNPAKIFAFEIQEDYALLARENAALCKMEDRIEVICDNVKNITPSYLKERGVEALDFIVSNPPYMKISSGALNLSERKVVARHEKYCDIFDIASAGKNLLKNGGDMYIIYRPDRLADMISALCQNGIEPKQLTFVKSFREDKSPCLVMCQAKKGAASGTKITALVIYERQDVYTKEMQEIYERSKFNE
jgi:tRNA1Val (adenine37-N6)-methyltransferase